jgi:hypothetical protein
LQKWSPRNQWRPDSSVIPSRLLLNLRFFFHISFVAAAFCPGDHSMATPIAACALVQPVGWQLVSGNELECLDGSVYGQNVTYSRSASCTEPFVELKLVSQTIRRLTSVRIDCNSKFIEIYIMRDNLLKYHSTLRGGKTEINNLFSASSSDSFEFKELHLKFLSIKPLPADSGTDTVTALQLTLSQVQLDFAPVAARAPNHNSSASGGSSNGDSGADMMAMMAMSMGMGMMGPGMGRPGGGGGGAGSVGGMGAGMPAMLSMALASMGAGAGAGGGERGTVHIPATAQNPQRPAAQLKVSPEEMNQPSVDPGQKMYPAPAGGEAAPRQASTGKIDTSNQSSGSASVGTGGSTAGAERRIPAPAVAGLDATQLASILWTVKGSIVQEIGELLDSRLLPVLTRLDRMEGRLGVLSDSVAALGSRAATGATESDDGDGGSLVGGVEAPLQHEVD